MFNANRTKVLTIHTSHVFKVGWLVVLGLTAL